MRVEGTLGALSDEVILHIFGYLGARDLCRNAQVSVRWHRLANDPFLWKGLFLGRFGDVATERTKHSGGLRRRRWRELYAIYSNWRRGRCDCFEVGGPALTHVPNAVYATANDAASDAENVSAWGGGDGAVSALELSPSGAHLVVLFRNRPLLRLWSLHTHDAAHSDGGAAELTDGNAAAHADIACRAPPLCVSFGAGHSRELLAVGMEGGHGALWSVAAGRAACEFASGDDLALVRVRLREGALVTLSSCGDVRVWAIRANAEGAVSVACIRALRPTGDVASPGSWDIHVSRVRRPLASVPSVASSPGADAGPVLGGASSWSVGISRVSSIASPARAAKRLWGAEDGEPETAFHVVGLQTVAVDSGGAVAWERDPLLELGVRGDTWISTALETSRRTRALCIALDRHHGTQRVAWGMSDNSIGVWDVVLGRGISMLYGHLGAVTCIRFERERLISGSADRSIKIWSLPDGLCEHTIPLAHGCALSSVAFDQRRIVSGDINGHIKVWDFGACTSAALSYGGAFRRPLSRHSLGSSAAGPSDDSNARAQRARRKSE